MPGYYGDSKAGRYSVFSKTLGPAFGKKSGLFLPGIF